MRWMWIDRVVELVPRTKLVAVKGVSLSEEHLHDHFAAREGMSASPMMPTSLIIEGMAQTAGLLVGHAEGFRLKVVLAKIVRAEVEREAVPGTTLRYTAEMERFDAAGASTKGIVELFDHAHPERGYQRIGAIDLIFSHLDNAMSAAANLPEHNFVFGDSFRTLMESSGVGG